MAQWPRHGARKKGKERKTLFLSSVSRGGGDAYIVSLCRKLLGAMGVCWAVTMLCKC